MNRWQQLNRLNGPLRAFRSTRRRGGAKGWAAGIGGLVVIVGAFLLGNWFNGFGLGPGNGPGSGGSGPDDSHDGTQTVATTEPLEDEPKRQRPDAEDEAGAGGVKVVNVLIDGDQYKLLRSPDVKWIDRANYRPAKLDEIVRQAGKVPGDLGVKVRVAMRGNAQPQAEERLKSALLDAGLDPTAVDWRDVTVP
jgi:hypothetical protein